MSNLSKLPQPGAPCLPPSTTDPQGKDAFILRFGTATKDAVPTGTPAHPANTDLGSLPGRTWNLQQGLETDLARNCRRAVLRRLSQSLWRQTRRTAWEF